MINKIGRKITSLTLMTIMLAGGMTIAFPGFTPDAYAVNANLIVSAENTGGYVDGAQIVEILVIDDDLDAAAFPDITVNGDAVAMTRTNDGNWYAYIADTDAVADVDNDATAIPAQSGIDFGINCDITDSGASQSYCNAAGDDQNVPAAAKGVDPDNPEWPFIQAYAFSSTIEIQYNKAGGTQITTLSFDDNADGLSLDRSDYPVGATVHVTIGDHRLNIDPTSADIWTWNMANGDKYYGAVEEDREVNSITISGNSVFDSQQTNQVCADCTVSITPNRLNTSPDAPQILVVSEIENRPLPAHTVDSAGIVTTNVTKGEWFTVREINGPNTAVFSATNLADESILTVSDTAARNSAAYVTYDGDTTDILVKHSTATIEIQSPDGVWMSGSAIPITVVDDDANKNSLSDETILVTDVDSIIPTLVTGDPFTLGNSNTTTWIGYIIYLEDIVDPATGQTLASRADPSVIAEVDRLKKTLNDDDLSDSTLLNLNSTGDDPFVLRIPPNNTKFILIGFENSADIESFSDRGILSFSDEFDDKTTASLEKLGIITDDKPLLTGFHVLVIDLDYTRLQDLFISDITGGHGVNMVNYDIRSFGGDPSVNTIDLRVNRTNVGNILTGGGPSGYIQIDQNIVDGIVSNPAEGQVQIIMHLGAGASFQLGDENHSIKSDEQYPMVLDFFNFGFKNSGEASSERIANQIIRLELEESSDNQGTFEGTLEYVMVNQLNILDPDTYTGISPTSNEASFIVIEDLTGSSAPSVTYLDVDTNGAETQVTAQQDAPSHSAVVTLNVDSLKTADTVTVTLEDLDLNTDSGLPEIYTVVTLAADNSTDADATNRGAVGNPYTEASLLSDGSSLGRLLDITFDDQRWMTHTDQDGIDCRELLDDKTGLDDTNFSLIETGDDTGIFAGTFALPAEFCRQGSDEPESVTGLDIEVNYVDFRDASGETTEVGDSAGVKASTGSVSLDRTVYPVPFGVVGDFDDNDTTSPSQGNTNTRSLFPIHQSGMDDDGELGDTEHLQQGDLIIYVTVTDPDFDVSASGKDTIDVVSVPEQVVDIIRAHGHEGKESVRVSDFTNDPNNKDLTPLSDEELQTLVNFGYERRDVISFDAPVKVSVIRGSASVLVHQIGDSDSPIAEIAPDAGIFESSLTIRYDDGPNSTLCPSNDDGDDSDPTNDVGCILQGDILQVEYNDPTDASGQPNTVTDSATFDLRNGVLQSDKSVYIIGSDMILTLIEPDLDLDSSQNETYDLDLIEWSSSAATVTMGDANEDEVRGAFDPEPLSFRETGPSTGIFQVVIEIPEELDGSSLQRGEEIDLEYTDWGPSGSDYVGDQDEDIKLTVFTSNFGATIDLDQKVYSWTDKVYITIVAPDHNFDNNLIDEIGKEAEDPLRVATKGYDLDNYRLVETGFDTGIFTGEVILTGFAHDPVGKGEPLRGGAGPTDGFLPTPRDGGISVSYEFSEDETVFTSSIVRWNIGDVQWLEASYPASGTGVLRVIDPDMNLNPEAVDNIDANIASHTDASGITLTLTETNEATGIFEGTVFFTTTGGSSGHRLRVSEGDTVTADYDDTTLPLPYTVNDNVSITSTTIIGTIVPPLERAPATNLRIVNTFGNSIDTVSVDQQVQIVADLSNGQDRDQDFAYLIQIQDSDGVTVSLSWIAGSLSPGQSFSPSASWTPTSAGTYDVTAFVWESIDNPTALSPPLSIDISVN